MFLPHLPPALTSSLSNNQFTTGGIMLMMITSFIAFVKGLPAKVWASIQRQTTVTITVVDSDQAFTMVRAWVRELPFAQKCRRVDVAYRSGGEQGGKDPLRLNMGPGTHIFWHHGRPVWFSFIRETKQNSKERTESFTFRTIGRRQKFVIQILREIIVQYWNSQAKVTRLWRWGKNGWCDTVDYKARTLDSVILAPGQKEDLLATIDAFTKAEPRYRQLGIPYHFGIELEGPPGTGKTSLASALGDHYNKSLFLINLSEVRDDAALVEALNSVSTGGIVLFEDIDAMGVADARAGDVPNDLRPKDGDSSPFMKGVTLSGLLNALDGLTAPDNVIYLMTTNHHDKLDPALLRAGRIDYHLRMGFASAAQKAEMYHRFFPDATGAEVYRHLAHRGDETMATFQGYLLGLLSKIV